MPIERPGDDAGREQESPSESPSEKRRSPSESPSEKGRSHASRRDSSAGRSPFVDAPGPEFRAEAPSENGAGEPDAAELHALPEPAQLWERETVESILTAQGSLLHSAAGVGEADWLYTQSDLMAIAPPLVRILNRYPTTRAAAGTGDELALMVGLGGYVARSYQERRAVLRMLAAQVENVPASGRAAEPGTGPPAPAPSPAGETEGGPEWRTE